jgi:hypoxanthine phosphoribosyltransferase
MVSNDSRYNPNQIICIARGGLRAGDILGRMLKLPLAILACESYKGREQRDFIFSRDLVKTTPNIGSRVLLVDDMADTGRTFKKSISWLDHNYGFYINEVKTASIWQKNISIYNPDYCASRLSDSPWIHMPFEKYEHYDL